MKFFAQATPLPQIKDIAPPFDIPFLPLWAVIALTVVITLLAAGLVWWLVKKYRRPVAPPLPPRTQALNQLQAIRPNIETDPPMEFTVQVSSILRKFVVGQYGIPATRQTSQEFLQSLTQSVAFSESVQALLKSFLDKCDLIEFARFDATSDDNRELWQKAEQFVLGDGRL